MQTSTDALFLAAVIIPAAAVMVCAGIVLGSSFVYWLTHATARAAERQPLAVDHPVGR